MVSEADRLLKLGQAADAIALIEHAAAADDANALYRLAMWRLVGGPLARDHAAARALLERAAKIGHVDAALLHAGLVANGTGGPADWPAALGLLREAATADHVAAEQLSLIAAMDLSEDGAPRGFPAARRLSRSPDVVLFERLFTPAECLNLARAADKRMAPSMVADPKTGKLILNPVRTSDDAVLGPIHEDLVIRALNRRLAAASGTAIEQGEPLTVLRYSSGQQYRAHHDGLPGEANQRILTMLVYLNEGYEGGATRFLASGLEVKGRAGDAVLFRNVTADGRIDPRSQHAGLPVTRGHKWLCTRWIRASPFDFWGASDGGGAQSQSASR